jgi:RNA polymerase primary sigma factor
LENFFNKERATNFLNMLGERERKILELRFGIVDGETKTLAQIAKILGVSRERVRQIEAATLKRIKLIIQNREANNENE